MFKKIIIILFALLVTGCGKQVYACSYVLEDKQINIDIEAFNDDIKSIQIRTCFTLPLSLINDEEKFNDFKRQLDTTYYFENDNLLIKEYPVILDKTYSLSKTLSYLQKEKYYCE